MVLRAAAWCWCAGCVVSAGAARCRVCAVAARCGVSAGAARVRVGDGAGAGDARSKDALCGWPQHPIVQPGMLSSRVQRHSGVGPHAL